MHGSIIAKRAKPEAGFRRFNGVEPVPTVVAIVRDAASLEVIKTTLKADGIQVLAAGNAEEGWELIHQSHADAILAEAELAHDSGILDRIADWDPAAQVLLITGAYTSEAAVEDIHRGARDCLAQPLSPDTLRQRIAEVLEEARGRQETLDLDEKLLERYRFEGMVGRSPQMLEIFARIRRVAPHYRIALLTGDTGTGKELVAQALHTLSPVGSRRFAVCNCSAIVETLIESELFGHVKGAFTGATQDRAGLFEYATGGTVFLDEISDMPLATQSRLLRVVQNQEVQRVGSPEVRKVDVRVIAATNRDLRALVNEGQFRQDLYYRLSMVEVRLPRLAERKEDLPLLERHLVGRFARAYGRRIGGISRRAQALLAAHGWPGNVRELENVLGHACMMAESEFIDVRDLPEYLHMASTVPGPDSDAELIPLSEVERRYTHHVLQRTDGNKLQAAQILGISRATLYRILREGPPASDKGVPGFLQKPAVPLRPQVQ